ncbi:hypothetical protein C8J31_1073 [Rhizobium sp. PP-CC-2G-626]|nr:hypothetical protein C8J31_1073 [Rhizobium sp. PP-CC-2G-626]
MKIWDTIYGKFDAPDFLDSLIMSPEFRRLSEVRLININSASLSALADVRRYSHTLGALRLALENKLPTLGKDEYRAFLASIIVHDAGTPAFAHLFEYFLMDRFEWDHEKVLPLLLQGQHHPDAHSHQIFSSQVPQFRKLCIKAKVDFDIVLSILSGNHPASKLIFGSVDFDNIDNVARMNWMLGNRFDVGMLLKLASSLGVASDGSLQLEEALQPSLELWLKLRRDAYQVLVFDGPTVAGQAVLSSAIAEALNDHTLSLLDWHYTDHELLRIVRNNSQKAKERLDRDFFGILPVLQILTQVFDASHPIFSMTRAEVALRIEQFLREIKGERRPYGYSLRDRGTFEKHVKATDPSNGKVWGVGIRSDSLVIYGFGSKQPKETPSANGSEFLKWLERWT